MTNEEKLKANMAAAKLLGLDKEYELHSLPTGSAVMISLDGTRRWIGTFDLFTNPSDCLAVVKQLVEKEIVIKKQSTNDYRAMHLNQIARKGHRSFELALAAAVLGATK